MVAGAARPDADPAGEPWLPGGADGQALLAAIAEPDETAVATVVAWIHPRSRARVADPGDAEEITRRVVLRLRRLLRSGTDTGDLSVWLSAAISHEAARLRMRAGRADPAERPGSDVPDPLGAAAPGDAETAALVTAALRRPASATAGHPGDVGAGALTAPPDRCARAAMTTRATVTRSAGTRRAAAVPEPAPAEVSAPPAGSSGSGGPVAGRAGSGSAAGARRTRLVLAVTTGLMLVLAAVAVAVLTPGTPAARPSKAGSDNSLPIVEVPCCAGGTRAGAPGGPLGRTSGTASAAVSTPASATDPAGVPSIAVPPGGALPVPGGVVPGDPGAPAGSGCAATACPAPQATADPAPPDGPAQAPTVVIVSGPGKGTKNCPPGAGATVFLVSVSVTSAAPSSLQVSLILVDPAQGGALPAARVPMRQQGDLWVGVIDPGLVGSGKVIWSVEATDRFGTGRTGGSSVGVCG